ncbi:hypothetical protein [Aquirufa ecclesiirivi]|uniref:hypothetical protein n=1 Tax=Aquirufa ecclesiirivi TaxID=2715124 RepID=UPI003BB18EC6
MVKIRNLKSNPYNLITPSSYIYFDIDDYPNAQILKDRFIKEYGHLVSLICLSSSCGGITFLFKVANHLKTEDDFLAARQYIIETLLIGEKIDNNAGGIGRGLFISHDPELFYNYENEIVIPENLLKVVKKCIMKEKKMGGGVVHNDCAELENFKPLQLFDVLIRLNLETQVDVVNPVLDFKEIEYVEVRFQYLIKKGYKHKTFIAMIHKLVYLNPDADRHLILSYLYHVNNDYTGNDKLTLKELIRLFDMVYNGIKQTNNSRIKPVLKRIHYNKDCPVKFNKRKVSGKIRGAVQENTTKLKIQGFVKQMENLGMKITISSISKFSGIHRATIKKHLGTDLNDINGLIQEINDSLI